MSALPYKSIHEAGHAIVALSLRRLVVKATVLTDGALGGYVEYGEVPRLRWLREMSDADHAKVQLVGGERWIRHHAYRLWTDVMILLAGIAAAGEVGYPTSLPVIWDGQDEGDWGAARKAIVELGTLVKDRPELGAFVGENEKRIFRIAYETTREIVLHPVNFRAIRALAEELQKRGSLTGQEVRSIAGEVHLFESPLRDD